MDAVSDEELERVVQHNQQDGRTLDDVNPLITRRSGYGRILRNRAWMTTLRGHGTGSHGRAE